MNMLEMTDREKLHNFFQEDGEQEKARSLHVADLDDQMRDACCRQGSSFTNRAEISSADLRSTNRRFEKKERGRSESYRRRMAVIKMLKTLGRQHMSEGGESFHSRAMDGEFSQPVSRSERQTGVGTNTRASEKLGAEGDEVKSRVEVAKRLGVTPNGRQRMEAMCVLGIIFKVALKRLAAAFWGMWVCGSAVL